MKLTPWFKPDQKPRRKGVYQRQSVFKRKSAGNYAYWDGKNWYQYGYTPDQALVYFLMNLISVHKLCWRGISK